MIGSRHVNPLNLNAAQGRFPNSVYARFPTMLRKLALLYAVVATVGAMLVFDKPAAVAVERSGEFIVGIVDGIRLFFS